MALPTAFRKNCILQFGKKKNSKTLLVLGIHMPHKPHSVRVYAINMEEVEKNTQTPAHTYAQLWHDITLGVEWQDGSAFPIFGDV